MIEDGSWVLKIWAGIPAKLGGFLGLYPICCKRYFERAMQKLREAAFLKVLSYKTLTLESIWELLKGVDF